MSNIETKRERESQMQPKTMSTVQNGVHAFIVDTEDYVGVFEKELAAYLTGKVGDYYRGDEYASLFQEDLQRKSFPNVMYVPDEHNMNSPSSAWLTPGWFNNGAGEYFKDGDEIRALVSYKETTIKEHMCHILQAKKIIDLLNKGEYVRAWTLSGCSEAIQRHEEQIIKAHEQKEVKKLPAYLSIGIYLSSPPSITQLEIMQMRAYEFNEARERLGYNGKPVIITGFRNLDLGHDNHL